MAESENKYPNPNYNPLTNSVCGRISRVRSELIFDFFEEGEESSDSSSWGSNMNGSSDKVEESFDVDIKQEEEEEDDENYGSKAEAVKAFWDSQEELLLATIRRTTTFESKIRQATKDALKELKSIGGGSVSCCCQKTVVDGCRTCTQEQICRRLQVAGYTCYICKSKWKSSQLKIPAGEHTYMEVVDTLTSKRSEVKVIIELNFQAEFVAVRACEEYSRLVTRLPEIFVGKPERLRSLVKILCSALKKCLKEKKMHMAPWRKEKYMQAKWVGKPAEKSQERTTLPYGDNHFERSTRPRASMLTCDLLDNLPGLNLVQMIRVL